MTDLLRVNDLKVEFTVHGGTIEAVRGVSFRVRPGSTVAIVGESGSGKSVVSQCIMGILPRAGRITGGEILFDDPEVPGWGRSGSRGAEPQRRGIPEHSRRPHIDHLPGADDLVVAVAYGGQPDRRGDPPAPDGFPEAGA